MTLKQIKFGLPRGSLNDEGRGNTYELLRNAGYIVSGYSPKRERSDLLSISNDLEIRPCLCKAQNAFSNLCPRDKSQKPLLDIVIVGDDAIREGSLGANLRDSEGPLKLAGLEYGTVTIVMAVKGDSQAKTLPELFPPSGGGPLNIYTEYPRLTQEFIQRDSSYVALYSGKAPVIEVRGFRCGDNEEVRIIYSGGTTEAYLEEGPIVDVLQSGDSLKRAGGRVLCKIMTSSAGLYARPGLDEDEWLWKKAKDIDDKLVGAAVARKYYDVKFNVTSDRLPGVIEYIKSEGLALMGPTVSKICNQNGSAVGYAINTIIPKQMYPAASAALKRDFGATGMVMNDMKQLIR